MTQKSYTHTSVNHQPTAPSSVPSFHPQNRVKYIKSILPFTKYNVATTITSEDDKWLLYTHTFRCPEEDFVYAIVEAKAVIKELSGKTVKVSKMQRYSGWAKNIKTKPFSHYLVDEVMQS